MRICLIFAAACLLPTAALACGNEVALSTDDQTRAVAKAEKLLETGEYGKAVKSLTEAAELSPMNFRFEQVFTDAPLRDRAQRVAAVASVRGRGQVDLNTPMAKGPQRRSAGVPAGLPPEEAARQLKWAVELLAKHHQAKADDPAGASLYGEGLAVQGKTAEAGKILEDLATRDLVPDAFGWRALAQVRAATGNAAGRDAALEKCRAVAVKADLCALDPGVGGT